MNSLARYDFERLPRHIHILLVEQEIQGSDLNALQQVLETDGERTELLLRRDILQASNEESAELNQIYERLEQIEADKAEQRAREILLGLGFTEELIKRKTKVRRGRATFFLAPLRRLADEGVAGAGAVREARRAAAG